MSTFRITILIGGITLHASRLRPGSISSSSSLLEVASATKGQESGGYECPPPQDCNCNCYCPELVWPGPPPPAPMYPTPIPHFSFLQNGYGSAATADASRQKG